jgi:rubrerythrin
MPHFDENGLDTWICQKCCKIFTLKTMPQWRPDITGRTSAGNVCPSCIEKHESKK